MKKRQKRKKCRRFRWSGEEQRVEIWVRRPDYKRCFTVEKWGGTPFQCQHSNEDAPKDIGTGLFLDGYLQPYCQIEEAGELWYHGRIRFALQRSQKDKIYLRAVCMYESLASDVTIKLYWSRCPFLKTHQPYLRSWKANSCNSSFSL